MRIQSSSKITNLLLIILGTYIMGVGINFFLLPNKITTGGASGIATILFYKLKIDMGLTIFLVNVPLFLIAIKKFGFKFCIKSMISTALFTLFVQIATFTPPYIDPFIAAIYGGLMVGLGLSFVFKAGASTGGSDLLAQILQTKEGSLNLSKILLMIDLLVIFALMISFKDINLGLYCAIAIFFSTKVIEIVFEGINYTKVINIITKNDTELVDRILTEIKRGATISKCIGAYTKKEHINITCVVTLSEIAKVRQIAYEIDPHAFIYVSNAIEVWGTGFKKF